MMNLHSTLLYSHTEVFFDFGPYFRMRCLHSWLKFVKKNMQKCDKKQRLSRKVNVNMKLK